MVGTLPIARSAHAAGDDEIKIALIGCGGRGTGAANQALSHAGQRQADRDGRRLPAIGWTAATSSSGEGSELKGRIDVPEDRKFVGFDAYQKAIAAGADLVILATPPGFRPIHFEAAVKAGKHVFMEKPVATDAPGVRRVLAAAEESKKKNLARRRRPATPPSRPSIWRRSSGCRTARSATSSPRASTGTARPPGFTRARPGAKYGRKLTEMEYQMRNWYYFTWLCGDHIVEQHIHNLDVINWLKNGYPVKANGMGGCQVRKGTDYGEIFDHHCRRVRIRRRLADVQPVPPHSQLLEQRLRARPRHQGHGATSATASIKPNGGESWRYRGAKPDPYQVEHDDLFASIRAGNPINEAEAGAKSTMTAILGRMCTYSGKELSWDEAINSQISLAPDEFSFAATPKSLPDANGLYQLPVPGLTKVV